MGGAENGLRKTGIDLIGSVPWGTHFCMFYQNKNDLLEILTPYFKTGLENNEFCMCVTSEPLTKEDAIKSFSESIPGFDSYLQKGQMEILSYTEWYTAGGSFEPDRVLQGWVDRLNRALASGYEGLRLTGNTFWLEKADWRKFTDYEQEVNNIIGNYKMIAVCTYSSEKCTVTEIMDVVSNHGFSLIKRENKWESIESSTIRKALDSARDSEEKYRRIIETVNEGMWITDGDRKTIFVNEKMADMLGYSREELMGRVPAEFLDRDQEEATQNIRNELKSGKETRLEFKFRRKDGTVLWVISSTAPEMDAGGGLLRTVSMLTDITRRKQAEESLERQKQELQTIIDSVPASIFYKDTENRFLTVNSAFCEMMGMPRERLEKKSLFDIYPAEQAQVFWEDDLNVLKSGKPKTGIIEEVQTAKGRIWAQTDKIPYLDTSGKMIGILGFAIDITAHRLADDRLKKYNRMLRAISSSNQALMHAKDEQDYISKVCNIIVKECGYKMSWIGLVEKDRSKSVHPVCQAGFEQGYLEKLNITWADEDRGRGPTGMAIRTGKTTICRNIMTDPAFKPWREEALKRGYASSIALPLVSDGGVFGALMLYSAEPDPFSDDEVKLLEELAIDLSYGISLIRARNKNTAAEDKIKQIATFPELNPNPISEINAAGRIGYMNMAFKKLFPGVEKDPMKHPWFKGMKSFFWALKGKKQEVVMRDVQAGDRYFLQTMLYMPSDEAIRTYGVEITKRKKAEQELQKLSKDLEDKVTQRTAELLAARHLADIGTLAATVAHELRNPLGVINVAAYNLRKKSRDKGLLKHVVSIEKKVAEGGQIINNLLVYSKMKMPQFEKTDISKLVSECAFSAKRHFGGKKIRLKTALKPVKGLIVDADPLQLKEVFNNIINNAYQAIESKKGAVEVRASVEKGKRVAISIKDTGVGINREDMGNIFKPFFTRKTKGTGLGLVICRDLVNMHNGSIDIKSKPGKGSTFTVTIPIRRN